MNIVKIVAITKPVIDGIKTLEEFVAYSARVSNPTNQMNNETAPNLLRYCIRNKHWSIFEMASITMEINTTRDIARQILRHRSFSFQEFSQRYAVVSDDMFAEPRETRLQDKTNRQNSIEINDEALKNEWKHRQISFLSEAQKAYSWALENGIAKEQARVVLPEGLTKSRLYMAGTLRSWIHYCQLRTKQGTQKEHMEVANACLEEIYKEVPNLKLALENAD